MTGRKVEDRLSNVERSVARIEEKLSAMELKLCNVKDSAIDSSNEDLSKASQELLSRVTICEMNTNDRLGKLEKRITEVEDKAVALGVRFQDFKSEFPTPAEAKAAESLVNDQTVDGNTGISCGECLKATKETVLVLGDSIARGVGDKLKAQCGKVFERSSRGGARIESVGEDIMKLKDDKERHLVVIAGTNNLESDDISESLAKYEKLLDNAKKVKHRQVTVVGVVKRYDLGHPYDLRSSFFETKRIVLNMKLKEMCLKRNIEYLGYDPERKHMEKDKLHLNEKGQNELASKIFSHCLRS